MGRVRCIAQSATFCRSLLTVLFSCHKIKLGVDCYKHRLRFSSCEKRPVKRDLYSCRSGIKNCQKLDMYCLVTFWSHLVTFGHILVTLGRLRSKRPRKMRLQRRRLHRKRQNEKGRGRGRREKELKGRVPLLLPLPRTTKNGHHEWLSRHPALKSSINGA